MTSNAVTLIPNSMAVDALLVMAHPQHNTKLARVRFLLLLFVVVSFVSIDPPCGSAQQKEAATDDRSIPPTGTYAPPIRTSLRESSPFAPPVPTNQVPLFTLRLETNGTYVAEALNPPPGPFVALTGRGPAVRRGTWRWDPQKGEFQLSSGEFVFYIKRLRVDKRDPDRLVWGSSFLERQESK